MILRGEPDSLRAWTESWGAVRLGQAIVLITIGAGLCGAAMGLWRAPGQALLVTNWSECLNPTPAASH